MNALLGVYFSNPDQQGAFFRGAFMFSTLL
jgi:hypothetical protein